VDAIWHQCSVEESYLRLGTSRAGLTAREGAQRRAHYGPNALVEAPPRSLLAMFAAQLADLMILIWSARQSCPA
jgi:magnesium-transporting ATPase (P-type)